ncbi:MAG TPA: coenzyme F420-0:L-glutamate ligase [Candidatus Limnocylindrales bacterium]|nr:coenzyme F420-0:L-glutamate ligase [Candidatus Limnocylindrales bacterium]
MKGDGASSVDGGGSSAVSSGSEDVERGPGGPHRLLAVALPALPEVQAGDDLAALAAAAWRQLAAAEPELAPRPGDVLVVTQKIVSKAEGAVVDLRGVEPRPEALAFARQWDRDPRQVEVVLREAAAVVRMERGVLIARTRHGFVCANAGVDASNVAPHTVTLLPRDPDASARALRATLADHLGLAAADAPAVLISDSFGRPWRWGIVDVALGLAGFGPLDDQRGRPDTAGRPMRSTIVAVADEIASAAELAAGKTSGRPLVLVRGATLPAGEGSIVADMVMPPAADLFP